ncbi:hypothetical protein AXF42_Ash011208 [Apostasia shenzhenica]|uniref:Uncharacterized protein n=1 Tax=Apostasia shenzhenica TaxID=1088818 RepID=A0A2I0AL39_9ASPA|nr:hypothetical protein AXF42_Ash011208 [Apostasia shenzhenica]
MGGSLQSVDTWPPFWSCGSHWDPCNGETALFVGLAGLQAGPLNGLLSSPGPSGGRIKDGLLNGPGKTSCTYHNFPPHFTLGQITSVKIVVGQADEEWAFIHKGSFELSCCCFKENKDFQENIGEGILLLLLWRIPPKSLILSYFLWAYLLILLPSTQILIFADESQMN